MVEGCGGNLAGGVFAVLGAGPGLGLETVRRLAEMGAVVACIDIDAERAHAAADMVGGFAIQGDLLSDTGFDAAMDAVENAGRGPLRGVVDVLGGSIGGSLAEADMDLVTRNFDLNLKHAFHVVRRAGAMIGAAGGGSLTFVGSLAGVVSCPEQAVYGSDKAALNHLVRCAGVELGPAGPRRRW